MLPGSCLVLSLSAVNMGGSRIWTWECQVERRWGLCGGTVPVPQKIVHFWASKCVFLVHSPVRHFRQSVCVCTVQISSMTSQADCGSVRDTGEEVVLNVTFSDGDTRQI